ncbi:MAG: YihY/virulence factor BrkB family protein [Brevundimonas sp.]|uniref:YihY/virulence factor BrkB family protein n=1 Tax=Brevundimonas sp. TaxID=1871086 RepID=UPI00391C0B7B
MKSRLRQALPYMIRFLRLMGRSFRRVWGRDVMLYTGGVSFFALLAIFPAIALLIGALKVVLSTGQITEQAAALADLVPVMARDIFENEVRRLSEASARTVSAQSAVALVIGAYAAHRGFKALLAGLNLIHGEDEGSHSFLKFNLLALIVAVVAFLLFTVISGMVVVSRVLERSMPTNGVDGIASLTEWLWAAGGLTLGLCGLYRYAMSHEGRVAWGPAVTGAVTATLLSLVASWLCAIYVEQVVELGATYGSVGAIVVMLIWLSWNVNAVFFGGALATELELSHRKRPVNMMRKLRSPFSAVSTLARSAGRSLRK